MAEQKKIKKHKKVAALVDFAEFRDWLSGLDTLNTSLHVNGPSYHHAVLTVDFGTPLAEQRLTPEQTGELVSRMRSSTKSLFQEQREINVRIQNDASNGVWWSSIG